MPRRLFYRALKEKSASYSNIWSLLPAGGCGAMFLMFLGLVGWDALLFPKRITFDAILPGCQIRHPATRQGENLV